MKRAPLQLQFPVTTYGRLTTDRAVAKWLRDHGLSPHYRPRQVYSSVYCRFIDRDEVRRVRECYDALVNQGWKCWQCGKAASVPRLMDLHHPLGYRDLMYEFASSLVAVHRGRCHRLAHEALQREQPCARPRAA
jgi:hypothetical protein